MARVKLDMPDAFAFKTEIPIRIGDVNYGGHLGNDAVLSLAHEARVRFLTSLGFSALDVAGSGIIMSDAAIMYRSEAFYGETLVIEVTASDFSRSSCDLLYRLSERETGREVARVKTGIVFFDYEQRKTKRVPELFKAIFDEA